MNIYNSVLLDQSGLIMQVRTTLFTMPFRKCITLYTFSAAVEQQFRNSFLPFHFNKESTALLETVLAGCHFVNRRMQADDYAELVITPMQDVINTVQEICKLGGWKAFAWRTASICNYPMIAVSLEK
jgi:hypothetical protein